MNSVTHNDKYTENDHQLCSVPRLSLFQLVVSLFQPTNSPFGLKLSTERQTHEVNNTEEHFAAKESHIFLKS